MSAQLLISHKLQAAFAVNIVLKRKKKFTCATGIFYFALYWLPSVSISLNIEQLARSCLLEIDYTWSVAAIWCMTTWFK